MMWGRPAISFVNAVVIGAGGRVFDSVRVSGGRIDRLGVAPGRRDVVIDLDESVVVPGLINAHDHLELNSFGRLKWREQYTNVREWIADFQPRFHSDSRLADARKETRADRVWVGGLKNMLSGVTTVCHHNPLHRTLHARFPVRVVRCFGLSHSLHIDGPGVVAAYRATPRDWPWIIHAAEGIDEEAEREILTLDSIGCLGRNTVLVHGVAINGRAERVIETGASLVWCPTSNHFLFGRTAEARPFVHAQRLAIGTDSRLSGDGDLLDELGAAHSTRQVSAESLVGAVTAQAAAVLRLGDAGRLAPGDRADLAVFRRVAADPFESVVAATRADLRLTLLDGMPLVADESCADAFGAAGEPCVPARVDGARRLLAKWIARRVSELSLPEPGLEVDAS